MTDWDKAYMNTLHHIETTQEREERRQDELALWLGRAIALVAIAAAVVWVVV